MSFFGKLLIKPPLDHNAMNRYYFYFFCWELHSCFSPTHTIDTDQPYLLLLKAKLYTSNKVPMSLHLYYYLSCYVSKIQQPQELFASLGTRSKHFCKNVTFNLVHHKLVETFYLGILFLTLSVK